MSQTLFEKTHLVEDESARWISNAVYKEVLNAIEWNLKRALRSENDFSRREEKEEQTDRRVQISACVRVREELPVDPLQSLEHRYVVEQ